MLEINTFFLSQAKYSRLIQQSTNTEKYPYYMSLARTMNSTYIKNSMFLNDVVIEFDGEKLSQNFKGKPVDWFGSIKSKSTSTSKFSSNKNYEAEDRLYSKKEEITNIKKYIKAIHTVRLIDAEIKRVKELKDNIPLYIYNNTSDLLSRNKNKAQKL